MRLLQNQNGTTVRQDSANSNDAVDLRVAGPEGIEPSTFGCPPAVKSFSLALARPLLYLSRATSLPD